MKILIAILAFLFVVPAAAMAQRLQLDHLDRLDSQASNTVNLTIDPAILRIAAGLLGGNRDNAALALLEDLQGIYIRSFEFDRDNAYAQSDVDAVRKQLAAPGWSPLVQVDSTGDREVVQIYSWREGDGGMAILVAEPRELTVVNIVGSIDLTRLGALQGQFGIPPLPDVAGPNR